MGSGGSVATWRSIVRGFLVRLPAERVRWSATVERLMRAIGVFGASVAARGSALGVGLHLGGDLGWVCLRRLRDRRLRPTHCWLARVVDHADGLRARCARTGDPRPW